MPSETVLAICEALARAGLSQAELARRLGTDRGNVPRWLSENYQGHTVATLERIAEVLGMRLEIRFVRDDSSD
ncbi:MULTISPECIES: helix-turn-helix transcriptional regulator [unclassified Meiothermus]|uniref:helix-turn-helix transcriptional regulator n=1 Tax=unclassified Meiothermus TaxID=370471 RepID=UPI000D7C154B|nr:MULTISPECIES: helix-turn-helix transcriptional regulator [unclassified Meiothermus]PZA06993.1 hypothetical protein DNA98_10035 [Meiothermus sp. Pnk-1]RYM35305.1 helix-turn-helix domain-containing protein [Meiothermus sp. PNK-Is4]